VGLAMFGVENVVDGFLALFTYSSWIFFISFLAKKFLKPKLQDIDIFLRFIYVSLVYITIALCPFLFDSVSDTLRIPQNWAFAIYLSSIALIMIWPITFYVAIRNLRNVAVDQIRLNNERLSWSSARLGAQLWAEKQKFAHLLHKDIQGALISSALKLKNDLDSGVNPTDSISKIRAFLEDSANLNLDEQSRTTSEHIEFLKDIWSGVLNLEIKISSKSNERLLNDPVAQNSVNDLLTEFATNSIKHGKAKFGKVQIELASEQVLLVNLQNDGLPLPKIIQHGMGSNMALEQCLTIDQKNLEPAGVEFTFTLPID
jgi:signal transduction histidine kinase